MAWNWKKNFIDIFEVLLAVGIIGFAIAYLFGTIFYGPTTIITANPISNAVTGGVTNTVNSVFTLTPTVFTILLISIVIGVIILLYVILKNANRGKQME